MMIFRTGVLRGRAAVAAVLAAASVAAAGAPVIHVEWSVNGGPVNTYWPAGSDSGSLVYSYEGTVVDAQTGIELDYDLVADPYASLGGNLSVFNDLDEAIDMSINVVMDFTPTFVEGSNLSGTVTVGLTTGAGGGQISSRPPALWQARIDNAVVGGPTTLFYDPFFLSSSGMGSASTHADFGIPNPVPGPPIDRNLGYSLRFSLTPLDTASITSSFTAAGEPLTCTGDIDTSGGVDTDDVLALLAAWGPCAGQPCDADVDGDGQAGIIDFLWVLANWGPCR